MITSNSHDRYEYHHPDCEVTKKRKNHGKSTKASGKHHLKVPLSVISDKLCRSISLPMESLTYWSIFGANQVQSRRAKERTSRAGTWELKRRNAFRSYFMVNLTGQEESESTRTHHLKVPLFVISAKLCRRHHFQWNHLHPGPYSVPTKCNHAQQKHARRGAVEHERSKDAMHLVHISW